MYFIRIKSSVFSGLSRSRCNDNLSVLSEIELFIRVYILFCGSIKFEKANLGFERRIREKENMVVNQAYFV